MRRSLLICLLLAFATIAAYWPVYHCGFVNYDDSIYVTANSTVQRGLTWVGFRVAFEARIMEWHPLTWLSHMLDCELFGLRAGGHHLVNLLFHVLNTLLLFRLLHRLTQALWRSALVAALFALHPLHVESVAWVAERKDVLCTFFFLLTIGAYCRYAKATERLSVSVSALRRMISIPYALALVFFTLALMSKPMVVTLPFVLLLLDHWPLRRLAVSNVKPQRLNTRRLVVEKLPFFVLSAGACAMAFWVEQHQQPEHFSFIARLLNSLTSYALYLKKTIWPADLAVFYPFPAKWAATELLGALVLLIGISIFAISSVRRRPYLAVGWFWYLGTLFPVIGIVQVGIHAMADRYFYIPSIGLFVMLIFSFAEIASRFAYGRFVSATFAALLLAGCFVGTRLQLSHWRDSETLFRHALRVTGGNHVAYNNLGNALKDQGKFSEAADCFASAARLKPTDPDAHSNAGVLLMDLGRFEEARTQLNAALNLNPRSATTHYNLGNLMARLDQRGAAIEHYQKALEFSPSDSTTHNNLACVLMLDGNFREAAQHFQTAIRLDPSNPEAYNNLGSVLTDHGSPAEAVRHLTKALQLKPAYPDAHCNLGNAYFALGKSNEAIVEYQNTLRLNPAHGQAHYKLGNLLLSNGNTSAAAEHYRAAVSANAKHAEAHYQLATALTALNQIKEGIAHYRDAVQLKPDWVEASNNLAWRLATSKDASVRDGVEALRLAQRVAALTQHKDAGALDTLAAAQAEAGEFSEAMYTAQTAIELAVANNEKVLADQIQARRQLYRERQSYRE